MFVFFPWLSDDGEDADATEEMDDVCVHPWFSEEDEDAEATEEEGGGGKSGKSKKSKGKKAVAPLKIKITKKRKKKKASSVSSFICCSACTWVVFGSLPIATQQTVEPGSGPGSRNMPAS